MKKAVKARRAQSPQSAAAPRPLLSDVRQLILSAREQVARTVNAALVALYWQIGGRIRSEVLRQRRADYGQEILSTLSKELTREFGQGYSVPNLSRMIHFAEVFPDARIVSTLSQELGWSHLVEILPLEDSLRRDFYAEMCRIERWSVRTLRKRIQSMLYERTALSRKPEELPSRPTSGLAFRWKTRSTASRELMFCGRLTPLCGSCPSSPCLNTWGKST